MTPVNRIATLLFAATYLCACNDAQGNVVTSSAGELTGMPTLDFDDGPPRFPWAVSIGVDRGRAACRGVLVGSRYVVTAAHCVDTYPPEFRPKWVNLASDPNLSTPVEASIGIRDCRVDSSWNEANASDFHPDVVADWGSTDAALRFAGERCFALNSQGSAGSSGVDLAVLELERPVPPASDGVGVAGWGADPIQYEDGAFLTNGNAATFATEKFTVFGASDFGVSGMRRHRAFFEDQTNFTRSGLLWLERDPSDWGVQGGDSGSALLSPNGRLIGIASKQVGGSGLDRWAAVSTFGGNITSGGASPRVFREEDGPNCNLDAELELNVTPTADADDPIPCADTLIKPVAESTTTEVTIRQSAELIVDAVGFDEESPDSEPRNADVGFRWCQCTAQLGIRNPAAQRYGCSVPSAGVSSVCSLADPDEYVKIESETDWKRMTLIHDGGSPTLNLELPNVVHSRREAHRFSTVETVRWDSAPDAARLGLTEAEMRGIVWSHSKASDLSATELDLSNHYSSNRAPTERIIPIPALSDVPCLRYVGPLVETLDCPHCDLFFFMMPFPFDDCIEELGPAMTLWGGLTTSLEDVFPDLLPVENFIQTVDLSALRWEAPPQPLGADRIVPNDPVVLSAFSSTELLASILRDADSGQLQLVQPAPIGFSGAPALHPTRPVVMEVRAGSPGALHEHAPDGSESRWVQSLPVDLVSPVAAGLAEDGRLVVLDDLGAGQLDLHVLEQNGSALLTTWSIDRQRSVTSTFRIGLPRNGALLVGSVDVGGVTVCSFGTNTACERQTGSPELGAAPQYRNDQEWGFANSPAAAAGIGEIAFNPASFATELTPDAAL